MNQTLTAVLASVVVALVGSGGLLLALKAGLLTVAGERQRAQATATKADADARSSDANTARVIYAGMGEELTRLRAEVARLQHYADRLQWLVERYEKTFRAMGLEPLDLDEPEDADLSGRHIRRRRPRVVPVVTPPKVVPKVVPKAPPKVATPIVPERHKPANAHPAQRVSPRSRKGQARKRS